MLSGKAAASIYGRMVRLRDANSYKTTCHIPNEEMREIGVSGRKIKTISSFISQYDEDAERYDNWRSLTFEELLKDVQSHWGMSHWSAQMLAIFHFSHADVRPTADGTIIKAEIYLTKYIGVSSLDGLWNGCSPHRSYLALLLWRAVDTGFFAEMDR